MADALEAILDLDTSGAQSSLQALADQTGSALDGVAQDFGASFESVVSGLPPIDVEADASAVPPEVESALGSVDGAVPVEADGAEQITGDVDDALGAVDGTVPVDADPSGIPGEIEAAVEAASPPEVVIEGDTGNLATELESVAGAAGDAGQEMDSLSGIQTVAAATAGAAAGSYDELAGGIAGLSGEAALAVSTLVALAAATGGMFNEAVQAQGATFRLDQTMGALAARVNTIQVGDLNMDLGDLALMLGSDDDAMRNVASTAYNMATSFGKSKTESADFSAELLAIASRAVALDPSLGDASGAAQRLMRALQSGRERALQPFNLGLTKAQIETRALQIAMSEGRSEINASDRAFAGVQLSVEKFGDTLDETITKGAQNPTLVLARLKQTVIENIEALGMPLVAPIFQIMEQGIPVAQSAGSVIAKLAESALPLLSMALQVVGPFLEAFAAGLNAIPDEALAVGLAILGVIKVMKALPAIAAAMDTAMAAHPWLLAAAAVITVVGALGLFGDASGDAAAGQKELTDAVIAGNGALDANTSKVIENQIAHSGLVDDLTRAGISQAQYNEAIASAGPATKQASQALADYTVDLALGEASNADFVRTMEAISPELGRMARQLVASGGATDELKRKIVAQAAAMISGSQAVKEKTDNEKVDTAAMREQAQAAAQQTAMTDAQTKAAQAHTQALVESTSEYAALALATRDQAAADANTVAIANQQALASRSVADAQAAAKQEQLAYTIAVEGAQGAAYRYAIGQGTAKESTDATSVAVAQLRLQLALLEGNYLGAVGADLTLQQQMEAFNQTLADQNTTLGSNRTEVLASQQAIVAMGNAAIASSQANAQNNQSIQAQAYPLIQYQGYLDELAAKLRATGDVAGADFVDRIRAGNQAAIDNLLASTPQYQGAAATSAGGAVTGVASQHGPMRNAGRGLGSEGTGGVGQGLDPARGVASQAGVDISNALRSNEEYARSAGYAIGWAMVSGIISGIGDGDVTGTLFNVIDNAISAAENKYTGSPSPQTRDQIGKPLGQGIIAGIESSRGAVVRAMDGIVADAVSAGSAIPGGPLGSRGAMPAGHGGLGTALRGGGHTYIEFNVAVSGVTSPSVARAVGEQVGEGAVDALTRRGYVTTARFG